MRRVLTALLLLPPLYGPAVGQSERIESAYTTFDTDKCRHMRGQAPEDNGSWLCAGYSGIPVWLAQGDERMYVSFGRKAADEPAANQTFAGFNDVFKGTIEWRLARLRNGTAQPFATILRWNVRLDPGDDSKPNSPVLVVTRLGPGGVCQVGYVDAHANPDANEIARKLADERARSFKCGVDTADFVGNRPPGRVKQ
jgi:hypothetical protein